MSRSRSGDQEAPESNRTNAPSRVRRRNFALQCLLDYLGLDNQEGLVTPVLQLVDWSYNGPAARCTISGYTACLQWRAIWHRA